MLHVCAKNGQARVAISLLDEMRRIPGLSKPNAKVWGAVLRACATRGEYKKAIEFLLEMRSDGVKPNVLHYNSVFAALAKSGEKDLALKLLNHMQNGTAEHFSLDSSSNIAFSDEDIISPSVQADLISLNTVLRAYTHPESADFDGAFKLLNRMKNGEFTIAAKDRNQRIDPDVISYNTVLSACEDPKVALSLLNEVSVIVKRCFCSFEQTHNFIKLFQR
jgi:pentatricopeptide repeat protein